MFCPFCLAQLKRFTTNDNSSYTCSACKESVPAVYVAGYSKYSPTILSYVGFRGHGKTVYLAALFHVLAHKELPQHWPGFYKMAPGDAALEILDANIRMLKKREVAGFHGAEFSQTNLDSAKWNSSRKAGDVTLLRRRWGELCKGDPNGEIRKILRSQHSGLVLGQRSRSRAGKRRRRTGYGKAVGSVQKRYRGIGRRHSVAAPSGGVHQSR
jgi:hypothetical protein